MEKAALNIFSEKFGKGGRIPVEYTCDGRNVNPPLEIEGLPHHTQSLAVILEDRDLEGEEAVHWLLYNLPAQNWISEDEKRGTAGLNRYHEKSYRGPCSEKGLHRYLFRVYALDDFLYFDYSRVSRQAVEEGIRFHLLGYGELEAEYGREAKLELMRIPH